MKTGTKSLLFGVHQFAWHPFTIWLAWIALYKKLPSFWETVAIVVHDWGYWGCEKMDDAKGEQHPHVGAILIARLYKRWHKFSWHCSFLHANAREHYLYELCLFHSRYLSAAQGRQPSKLCWADKYSMRFDPAWFYLLRARLSGELKEYRMNAAEKFSLLFPDWLWYDWLRKKCIRHALNRETASSRNHGAAS
jgi:hypothetical protein